MPWSTPVDTASGQRAMNPIDNNSAIRPQRSELDQGARRSQEVERGGASAPAAAGDRDSSAGESVSLTRTAADLLALETQLKELPGFDQTRVESIRQAIDNGSYQIDTDRIVNNLLQSDRELG